MRVEVLRSFVDKETKEVVHKGTIIENMTEERFNEIMEATAYVKKIDDKEEVKTPKKRNLSEMTVKELREIAKEKEIPDYHDMNKEELLNALSGR